MKMKALLKKFIFSLLNIFYPKVTNISIFPIKLLLSIFWMQKILGFNRRIPWPVHFTSQIKFFEKIECGNESPGFSIGCYLDARNGIILEKNVHLGPKVTIISMDHNLSDFFHFKIEKPIIIHKNSLLLSNCIILPEVELGEHTIVAAGAVVTKSFPEGNQILAGNPARVIKKLEEYKGTFNT